MDIKNKRAQVIVNLHKLRRKAKELEATQSTGSDKKADIEACRGEINVLQKELDSIDDAGHTTFMNAKNMLEPKKGISDKNRRIKWRKTQIEELIKKLEASQEESDVTDEERTETATNLAKFREELASLDEEKAALKDFNHTRFMAANKDDGQGDKQNTEIEQVNKKIHDLETKLERASKEGGDPMAEDLQEELHLLKMEKESIENFTHDLFLKNLANLKAKRRSELK
jgi:predicted  nucleic acid-binding Zn-ribbon protein